MRSLIFSGVNVSIPAKVRGSEAEEEWQEVDWVNWSTGKLEVSTESFLLLFQPAGAPDAVKPKPLGNVLRSSPVAQGKWTLTITTSDPIHQTYRFAFDSERSFTEFAALAERAQAAHEAAKSFEPNVEAVNGMNEEMRALQSDVQRELSAAGFCPLTFGDAELVGPDPAGEAGSEVLLGSGVVVLLDPPEKESKVRIGKYELLFYSTSAGHKDPIQRFDIGPRMSLKRVEGGGAAGDTEPMVTYSLDLGLPGAPAYAVSFESPAAAEGFSRDFRVRQRLMEVSLKTARSQQTARELHARLRERSLYAQASKIAMGVALVLLLVALVRLVMLVLAGPGRGGEQRGLGDHVATVLREAQLGCGLAWRGAAIAHEQACRLGCGV